ncbi:MAG: acetyl-CoA acetyltransferase [Acidimicrobiales bacterium]|nr:acetyl-CoA acetyltransferase [Acidimicrobiales bacterium]
MTTGPDSLDPRTPVIIGVGQIDVPEGEVDPTIEPIDLAELAVRTAARDTGSEEILAHADAVRVVAILSWRYPDPGAVIAGRVGAPSAATAVSPMGGNSPQMLVNRSALDIAAGRHDVVVIAGAEAWRTRQAFRRDGTNPPWAPLDESTAPAPVLGAEMEMSHPAELARGMAMPVNAYPIIETAVRSNAGRSPADHLHHIGSLWARFSDVAATNPHAAVHERFSAERLITPAADNRWVGYPYTKWLCSNDRVDQSAALIMCSAGRAEALGVPRERWVFPWAGTDTSEPTMSLRQDLDRSPAIRIGGRRALEMADLDIDDVAHIDLYSCFSSAVQIGARELGIALDRQLSVTGGLTFAGGPQNNYVTHSIATMVGVLRDDPGSVGLCTANGGLISKHSFGLYSTTPPAGGFRHESPQAEVDLAPHRDVITDHHGPATIEAYTVMHTRDGEPATLMAAALTPDGHRAWATSDDPELMAHAVAEELCGREAAVEDSGRLRLP